jgi:hypothetical protein
MVKNSAGYWTHPTQESVLAACLDHSPDFGGFGLPGPGDSWESFSLVNEAGESQRASAFVSSFVAAQHVLSEPLCCTVRRSLDLPAGDLLVRAGLSKHGGDGRQGRCRWQPPQVHQHGTTVTATHTSARVTSSHGG